MASSDNQMEDQTSEANNFSDFVASSLDLLSSVLPVIPGEATNAASLQTMKERVEEQTKETVDGHVSEALDDSHLLEKLDQVKDIAAMVKKIGLADQHTTLSCI